MTDNEKMLIHIPANGGCIEILGHHIDGFDSFEAFCEHLKKYSEKEETINRQKAEIERLTTENKKQQAIIEKMSDFIEPLPFVTDYDVAIKVARGEGAKMLGKRLKKEGLSPFYIDKLVKELEEVEGNDQDE